MDKSSCWNCVHVNVCCVFPQALKLSGNQGVGFVVTVEVVGCSQFKAKKEGD